MKKILITGFSGFVGKHFLDYLDGMQEPVHVFGVDLKSSEEFKTKKYKKINFSYQDLNLLDKDGLFKIVSEFRPDQILHLASFSSVAYSWQNPVESFQNNINIFLNLTESVRQAGVNSRILSIGSSEEYGNINEENLPLKETSVLDPVSPYAVARVSQEMLSRVYVNGFGMDIVITRSFNHIGTGQDARFVIPSFIKQLVEIEKSGKKQGEMKTGDLSIIRDFSDVRDVVRAYYMLLEKGKKGEIYNVCSSKGYSLKDIIDKASDILNVKVVTETLPELVRPNDNRIIIGDNSKISGSLGWKPEYTMDATLNDVILDWKGRL